MRILYFAPISYDGLKQRPQYIAEGLAREHDVTYIEPTVSMMKYVLKGGEKPSGRSYEIHERLRVLRMDGRFSLHRSMDALGSWVSFSERIQLKKIVKNADLIWIGYEPWFSFFRKFSGKIVYDQMDDNVGLTPNPLMRKLVASTRTSLLARADVLFVTAKLFYDEAAAQGLSPIHVPNAVDIVQPMSSRQTRAPKEDGTRVFGYVGMLSHWFDLEAVQTILDAAPENRVVLVGPEELERIEDPRVRYIGAVPKDQVGDWIDSFDVCLYTFRLSPLVDTINPVKIYEYLAQNKPVIAVDSRETEMFGSRLLRYRTQDELRAIAAVDRKPPFATEEERMRFIAENSWDERVKLVLDAI